MRFYSDDRKRISSRFVIPTIVQISLLAAYCWTLALLIICPEDQKFSISATGRRREKRAGRTERAVNRNERSICSEVFNRISYFESVANFEGGASKLNDRTLPLCSTSGGNKGKKPCKRTAESITTPATARNRRW